MIGEAVLRKLLEPFELELSSTQLGQILTYLGLLLRWNQKINLTSIRSPEECVTRHFGESLYLARWTKLSGQLLDVGSGAGFPGLALRIVFPELRTTLLEPVAKKRAFLKEAARACEIDSVDVRPERLEEYVRSKPEMPIEAVTARAVGEHRLLVLDALKVLRGGGKIFLWLGNLQGLLLPGYSDGVEWADPIKVPGGREREIWVGRKKA